MASFDINGKVALITGGASGLGLQYAIDLLRKGAKGITLADVVPEVAEKALQEIENKFGKNKAIFVKTDVTNYNQFEDAFKQTISTFKNVDILINNAGIMNDSVWQKEININVNGTIHGILLGLDNYIPKHKSGPEGLIVNISSIAGICPYESFPIYIGSKFAVHGMTLSWGLSAHYDRTKVRVVGVCPGVTLTPLILDSANRTLGSAYEKILEEELTNPNNVAHTQTPEQIVPHVTTIIERAPSGTMWVVEAGEAPYQFQLPDRFKMEKVYLQ